jgi:hypothetical protein
MNSEYQTNPDSAIGKEEIEQSIAIARMMCRCEITGDHPRSTPLSKPRIAYNQSSVGGTIAWFMRATAYIDTVAKREKQNDDVKGMSPDRVSRSQREFEVDRRFGNDKSDRIFTLLREEETSEKGDRAIVDIPKPWECPDELKKSNQLIKTVDTWEWLDDKKLWSISVEDVEKLKQRVIQHGYDWEDSRDCESEIDEELVLDNIIDFTRRGDEIDVTYRLRSRVGTNEKTGEVNQVVENQNSTDNGNCGRRIEFTNEDGQMYQICIRDSDKLAVLSSGDLPIGDVLSVSVTPP